MPTPLSELATQILSAATALSAPQRDTILAAVAKTYAEGGDDESARALAEPIAEPVAQISVLCRRAAHLGREPAAAEALVEQAARQAAALSGPARDRALTEVVTAEAELGRASAVVAIIEQVLPEGGTGDPISTLLGQGERGQRTGGMVEAVQHGDRPEEVVSRATPEELDALTSFLRPDSPAHQLAADLLGDAANACIRTGRVENALDLLAFGERRQLTVSLRSTVLAHAVEQVAVAGEIERARSLLEQITDPRWRDLALGMLAAACVRFGQPDAAQTFVEAIQRRDARDRALADMAIATLERGLLQPALDTARAIKSSPAEKDRALAAIACYQQACGEVAAMRATLMRVRDPDRRANLLQEALAATATLEHSLARAALVQLRELVETIASPVLAVPLWVALVRAHTAKQQEAEASALLERARAAVTCLEGNASQRAATLATLAVGSAQLRQLEAARAHFDSALSAVDDSDEPVVNQAAALDDVARILAEAGLAEWALEAARAIALPATDGQQESGMRRFAIASQVNAFCRAAWGFIEAQRNESAAKIAQLALKTTRVHLLGEADAGKWLAEIARIDLRLAAG